LGLTTKYRIAAWIALLDLLLEAKKIAFGALLPVKQMTPAAPTRKANWPPNARWLVNSSCGIGEPFQKRCHRVVIVSVAWDFDLGDQPTTPGNRCKRHVLVG
jgi:hypothetical protein